MVTEMSTIELWSEIYGGMTSLQAVMPSITDMSITTMNDNITNPQDGP